MKLCPLKFNNQSINADNITDNKEYKCEKENCEWWDKKDGKCVIHNLYHIANGIFNGHGIFSG